MPTLTLPTEDGGLSTYTLTGDRPAPPDRTPPRSRVVYAAAHVVADPLADNTPGAPATVDWEATLAFRHHLWSHGLGVADAMDTAQRGMGLDWAATQELVRRSGAEAQSVGGRLVVGASTDQLPPGPASLDQIVAAYAEQAQLVEEAGGTAVLMASRHLAAAAATPEDYAHVYGRVLAEVSGKVVLHWLGPMFDPALAGYWGSADLDEATAAFLQLIKENAARIDGIKVSLLDARREVELRRALPDDVRCYTGDDFNYPELIRGDEVGHSDALLGIFDGIAPVAAPALRALDAGDADAYDRLFASTVPLSRHVFQTPTYHYKTGIVFLAWLSGHQDHFVMVGGLQSARSVPHLARLLVLADQAGLLPDPDLAARRMRQLLDIAGVPA
jgi:hypothetical protein